MSSAEIKPFIVVGVDGSPESIACLEWATGIAGLLNAKIVALTAFEIPWTINITPTYVGNDYKRDAQQRLDHVREAVAESTRGADIEFRLERSIGRPALALTEAARGAELLVVSGRGRNGSAGMHLGSVASYCAHHAPCPVLVHR